MRHRKSSKKLGRKTAHRKATLMNMALAILTKERIKTTKIKAKVAQSFIEKLITIAKRDTPESKRHIFALVRDKEIIDTLFNEVAPRFKSRNGGYTRVIPLHPRRGDGSPMAILELVEKKAKIETKKPKKTARKPEEEKIKKESPQKPDEGVTPTPETKKEPKTTLAPPPKADVKEEIRREKAKDEEKRAKKGNIFKNLRRYFRGKSD